MTAGYTTAGYAGSPGFYSTPYSYPGYYGAFGHPVVYYVSYSYGYPPYSGYGFNYWNPVYYAGNLAGYPYGYRGFYGSYEYPPATTRVSRLSPNLTRRSGMMSATGWTRTTSSKGRTLMWTSTMVSSRSAVR